MIGVIDRAGLNAPEICRRCAGESLKKQTVALNERYQSALAVRCRGGQVTGERSVGSNAEPPANGASTGIDIASALIDRHCPCAGRSLDVSENRAAERSHRGVAADANSCSVPHADAGRVETGKAARR